MEIKAHSMNVLKDTFYSLKHNKSPSYGDISYNVLKKCFYSLFKPLKYLLNLSIKNDIFPDDLKKARTTPIYKGEDSSDVSNYKLVSVPPCFQNTRAHNV